MIVGDKKYEIFRYAYRKESQPPKATFIVSFTINVEILFISIYGI